MYVFYILSSATPYIIIIYSDCFLYLCCLYIQIRILCKVIDRCFIGSSHYLVSYVRRSTVIRNILQIQQEAWYGTYDKSRFDPKMVSSNSGKELLYLPLLWLTCTCSRQSANTKAWPSDIAGIYTICIRIWSLSMVILCTTMGDIPNGILEYLFILK